MDASGACGALVVVALEMPASCRLSKELRTEEEEGLELRLNLGVSSAIAEVLGSVRLRTGGASLLLGLDRVERASVLRGEEDEIHTAASAVDRSGWVRSCSGDADRLWRERRGIAAMGRASLGALALAGRVRAGAVLRRELVCLAGGGGLRGCCLAVRRL